MVLLILGGGVLTAAIALVGYFGVPWWKKKHQGSKMEFSMSLENQKDPSFSSVIKDTKKIEKDSHLETADAVAVTEGAGEALYASGQDDIDNADEVAEQQEKLSLDEFIPPELPEPSQSLLYAKEFCYIIQFYAEKNIGVDIMQQICDIYKKYRLNCYRILGFDESAKEWKLLGKSSYRYLLFVLPLADRGGKLSKEQIKLIEEEGRSFAERMKIRAIFPTPSSTLKRVEVLDAFCEDVDVVVEFRIRTESQHTLQQINEYFSLNKMVVNNKRAVFRKDSEEVFYAQPTVQSNHTVQSVLFSLDVPKVTRPIQALDDMIILINRFATNINGTVVDHQGQIVDANRIAVIREQLVQVIQKMNANNVPPGGSLSHLLFS